MYRLILQPLASASPPYINFVSSAGEQATAGATSPESPEDAVLASLKEMYPLTFSTLRTVYEQYQAAMKASG